MAYDKQILEATRGSWLQDVSSDLVSVGVSETLAELGVTIGVNAEAVSVYTSGAVFYNPVGAATAASGLIPVMYTIYGPKSVLDLCEFYTASAVDMTVIVHERTTIG